MKNKKDITGKELGGLLFNIHNHYPSDEENFNQHNSEKIIYFEEDLLAILEAIGLPKVEWGISLDIEDYLKGPKKEINNSRIGKILPLDDFICKINKITTSTDFPYKLPKKIESDLSKVEFSWENYNFTNIKGYMNYPCGYEILSNGLQVFFINAGGDWEIPICFILYWDGESIRAYIPTDGNLFNNETKSAYGNNDEDYETIKLLTSDSNAIRNDIMNRIKIIS